MDSLFALASASILSASALTESDASRLSSYPASMLLPSSWAFAIISSASSVAWPIILSDWVLAASSVSFSSSSSCFLKSWASSSASLKRSSFLLWASSARPSARFWASAIIPAALLWASSSLEARLSCASSMRLEASSSAFLKASSVFPEASCSISLAFSCAVLRMFWASFLVSSSLAAASSSASFKRSSFLLWASSARPSARFWASAIISEALLWASSSLEARFFCASSMRLEASSSAFLIIAFASCVLAFFVSASSWRCRFIFVSISFCILDAPIIACSAPFSCFLASSAALRASSSKEPALAFSLSISSRCASLSAIFPLKALSLSSALANSWAFSSILLSISALVSSRPS